jgi:hypothetical protein
VGPVAPARRPAAASRRPSALPPRRLASN